MEYYRQWKHFRQYKPAECYCNYRLWLWRFFLLTHTTTNTHDCTAVCQKEVSIVDTTAPVFTTIPADMSVECDGEGNTLALTNWLTNVAATDNCGLQGISHNFTGLSDLCGATGAATVTWTATDVCGNTAITSATFTITDNTAPTFTTLPENITLQCDGSGNTTQINSWLSAVTASDVCGSVTISNDFAGLTAACGATGEATVTWTAMDACGNTATTSATVTVVDTTAPYFTTAPANLTLECDGAGNTSALTAWLNSAVAADVCGSVSVSHNFTGLSDLCGATGAATVTWTAMDACGNTATTSATVTVVDTTAPVISCNPAVVVPADEGEDFATIIIPVPSILEICGTYTLVNDFNSTGNASGQYPLGTTVVTWTATDACGNISTCSFTVTVQDEEAPVIICPPTVTVGCPSEVPAAFASYQEFVAAGGEAYDNNEIVESSFVLLSESSDGQSCPEIITRIYQIADDEGNTSTCSHQIIIHDLTTPLFTLIPEDLTVECDGNSDTLAQWLTHVAATDNCSEAVITHNFTGLSDLCGATGAATVIWTAMDACGNIATTTATFTIVDTTPPAFVCTENILVAADEDESFATLSIATPAVTDLCGSVTIINDFNGTDNASGQYPLGTTVVTWTATDACGNISTCSFTVTVQDDEAPVIICPPTVTVGCPSEVPAAFASYEEFVAAGGEAYDNNEIVESSFVLLSESSNGQSCPEIITRIYQIADDEGNTSTCSHQIIIHDLTAPLFTLIPEDLTVECDGNSDALVQWLAHVAATDNCSEAVITHNFTGLSDLCGATGAATVIWTAMDACGNIATTTATFTIVDTTPPAMECPESLMEVFISPAQTGYVAQSNEFDISTASDACGSVTLTHNLSHTTQHSLDGYEFHPGDTEVIWTATDACGNTSECIFTVRVSITGSEPLTLSLATGNATCFGADNGWATATVSGGAPPYTISWITDPPQEGPYATTLPAGTYNVTVEDMEGNMLQDSFTIHQPDAPISITSQTGHLLCHQDQSGSISIQVSGGTPPYAFSWSNGATTQNIFDVAADIYQLIIEDSQGCQYTETFTLQQPEAIGVSNISIVGVEYRNDPTGSIHFETLGGTAPYTYLWNNGAQTPFLENIAGGDYEVRILDNHGCDYQHSFFVHWQHDNVAEEEEVRIPQAFSPNNDGHNDVWVIRGLDEYPAHNLQVFNRYGTLVFQASPYDNNWDGTPNRGSFYASDGKLPAGTYYYILTLQPGQKPLSGWVYIAR
ncbi:MAG: HYR domain-containing protein [Bacteroidales bacterium]